MYPNQSTPASFYRRRSSTNFGSLSSNTYPDDVFYTPRDNLNVQATLLPGQSFGDQSFATTPSKGYFNPSVPQSQGTYQQPQLQTQYGFQQPAYPSHQQYQEDDGFNPLPMEYYMTDDSKPENDPHDPHYNSHPHGHSQNDGKDTDANYLPSLLLDALAGSNRRSSRSPGPKGRGNLSRSPARLSQPFLAGQSGMTSFVPKTPFETNSHQSGPSGTPQSYTSPFKPTPNDSTEESTSNLPPSNDPDAPPTRALASVVPGAKKPVSFARSAMKLSVSPPRGDSPHFGTSASPSPVFGRSARQPFVDDMTSPLSGSPQMYSKGSPMILSDSPRSPLMNNRRDMSPLNVPSTPTPHAPAGSTSATAICAGSSGDVSCVVTVSGFPSRESSFVWSLLEKCGNVIDVESSSNSIVVRYTNKVGAAQALHLDGRLLSDASWKLVVKRGDPHRLLSTSSRKSMSGILKSASTTYGKDSTVGGLATSSHLLLNDMDAPPPLLTREEALKNATSKVYPDLPSAPRSYSSVVSEDVSLSASTPSTSFPQATENLPKASPVKVTSPSISTLQSPSKSRSESTTWQNGLNDLPGSDSVLIQPAGMLSRISDFLFGW